MADRTASDDDPGALSAPAGAGSPRRVFGVAGRSGSGKTTLIEAMLPLLTGQGLRVNVIKHSHHDLTLEPAGKDSARFRAAGAHEVLVASPYRFAILHELAGQPEPDLAEQLARLASADLTLVEGFKHDPIPRIEVYRPALGQPPLLLSLPGLCAVASDAWFPCPVPLLDLNRPAQVAAFILETFAHAAQP
ncbi:molybdopterin-guanine dinucleotide biosynthesis protein B [Chitiniphilus purpureus]|uniref:Molybdopterin-guanine dinucleotide biosynthesis protein B n=1 Tax=Chitiniphilus purpureus TaxID=2981137 RepID=A0ABY6DNB9_9NEIS|nr:molybdopterin-guanine dinucleotide biosynthesis protein B [Chitiniphilus sp. CD1]UXY15855.1 molybdopterin-guanine dinucleotide biosynthesis protein B [Chitiniphilus sp. CD1]